MNKIWILGPCSMENEEFYIDMGKKLSAIMGDREWYFKASFDKANRTSIHGGRGFGGTEAGAFSAREAMLKLKRECPDIKLTTDFHEVWQPSIFADVVDVAQIPAFLCRQTDLIVNCAQHFKIVNVKKGQWLGPRNVTKSIDKIKETNPNCQAWLTERGTSFGYDRLLVDFTIVDEIKSVYDKYILDATHSTQRSREIYGVQGDRKLAERYFLMADIAGYDGVFAETHPNPVESTSDGDCLIYLNRIKELIQKSEEIKKVL